MHIWVILVGITESEGLQTPVLWFSIGWGLMCFHNVPVVSSSASQGKGWERHLVLCKELSRSQSVSQRRLKKSPAITALAVSRYGKNPSQQKKAKDLRRTEQI